MQPHSPKHFPGLTVVNYLLTTQLMQTIGEQFKDVIRLFNIGCSIIEIATALDFTISKVRKIMKLNNLDIKSREILEPEIVQINYIEKYSPEVIRLFNAGKKLKEIESELFLAQYKVRRIIAHNKLDLKARRIVMQENRTIQKEVRRLNRKAKHQQRVMNEIIELSHTLNRIPTKADLLQKGLYMKVYRHLGGLKNGLNEAGLTARTSGPHVIA